MERTLNVVFEKVKVKDYIDYIMKEVITIPSFQRRGGIWNNRKKSNFILSQMFYFTTPLIIKKDKYSEVKKYHLIDGLQRTNTILTFINDEFSLKYDISILNEDEIKSKYIREFIKESDNKKFSELSDVYKDLLLNSELNIVILEDTGSSNNNLMQDMIYIYKMININSTPLNKSEMRYAIYYCPNIIKINDYIRKNAEKLMKVFKIKFPHKRMKDMDLFLRMLGIYLYGEELIDYYTTYDKFLNQVAFDIYGYHKENESKVENFLKEIDKLISYMYNNDINTKSLLGRNYSIFDIIGISLYVRLSSKEFIEFINHLIKNNESFIKNIAERDNMRQEVFKERIKILLEEVDKIQIEEDIDKEIENEEIDVVEDVE